MTQLFSVFFYCLIAVVHPNGETGLNNCQAIAGTGVYFRVANDGPLSPTSNICVISIFGTKKAVFDRAIRAFVPCVSIGKRVK